MVVIPGAKVREEHGAGQPVRRLLIDETSPAGIALAEILGDAERLTVKRAATRLNKDFADIRRKVGGTASPYSMRHRRRRSEGVHGSRGSEKGVLGIG